MCTFFWPLSQLVDLTNILNNYKDFKTKDVEESGRGFSKVMSSGLPMPVSKTLFRKFGRLSSSQVEEMKKPVNDKEISLKEAVENAMKENDRIKTLSLAGRLLGNLSTEQVMSDYSRFFEMNVLDSYRGAIAGVGGNQRGKDLEDYCQSLLMSDDISLVEPKVEIQIVSSGFTVKGSVQVAVLTGDSPKQSLEIIADITTRLKKENPSLALVTVYESNEEIEETKEALEAILKKPMTEIFFTKQKAAIENNYKQNIIYSLTAGKVFGKPINKINGDIKDDLNKVVASLSPPEARIASFPIATCVPLTLIHTEKTRKVSYYSTQKEEPKLMSLLKKNSSKSLGENNSEVINVLEVSEPKEGSDTGLDEEGGDITQMVDEQFNNTIHDEEGENSDENECGTEGHSEETEELGKD